MNEDLILRLRAKTRVTAWKRGVDTDYPTASEPDPDAQEAADALEAMQADAARYRWLRSTTDWVSDRETGERIDVRNSPQLWDTAIDSAMKVSGAAAPMGQPAGEQTRASTAAPTLTDEQISNRLWEAGWPEVMLSDFVREKLFVFARAIERAVRSTT